MLNRKLVSFFLILFSFCTRNTMGQAVRNDQNADLKNFEDQTRHCTIVAGVNDKTIFIGNNEDWIHPFTTVYVIPASDKGYGRVLFGFAFSETEPGYCGGVNEKGLFIDGNGIEDTGWKEEPGKESFCGNVEAEVLSRFATVEEVIDFFKETNVPMLQRGKWLVADRSGASVVLEWGQNSLQVLRRKGNYQISTNFVQSNYPEGEYPDFRYNLAEKIFKQAGVITADVIKEVLNDNHWEDYGGSWNVTLYSYICDLKKGDFVLYNFHNYDHPVSLNIHAELKKGAKAVPLSSLFPYETYAEQQYKAVRVTVMLIEKAIRVGVTGEGGAVEFYRQLTSKDAKLVKYNIEESYLNAAGYNLLARNKIDKAIDLFSFVVEEYPRSADAFDSLGEAYAMAGNKEMAIKSYEKSLELNPNNENAKNKIEELQK